MRFGAWNPKWTLLAGGAVQWNGVYLQLYIGGEWKNIISRSVAHECKIKLAGEEPAMVSEGALVLEKSLFTAMT